MAHESIAVGEERKDRGGRLIYSRQVYKDELAAEARE